MISANIIPTYSVASHWTVYHDACRSAASRRVAITAHGPRPDRGAVRCRGTRPRVQSGRVEQLLLQLHARGARQGRVLVIVEPKPDMPDAEATVEKITAECVLHGSP